MHRIHSGGDSRVKPLKQKKFYFAAPSERGEDADNGTCDGVLAYHIDKGKIDGTDVSGLSLGLVAHIPGNILQGNWRIVVFMDDKASPQQQEAILNAWTGKLGGPLADMAKLVGEVIAVDIGAPPAT